MRYGEVAHTRTSTDIRTQRDILLDHLVGVLVADLDGASHIPGDVNHGHDRLHLLHLVPLEALQGELILVRWGSKNTQTIVRLQEGGISNGMFRV